MEHATTIHYNNEVEFFQAFLDPYLKYTSGLFEDNNTTLEQAIVCMLDRLILEANLTQSSSILEIGSGWGSLIRRLQGLFPGINYTGLSPASVQNEFIRKQKYPNCDIIDTTFEAWDPKGKTFDAIFLIGSYCHLRDKAQQLSRIASMLKPNGRIIIEDTCFLNEAIYQKHKDHPATKFVQQKIFGYAEIPSLSWQMDAISHAGLKVVSLLDHSDSYAKTIGYWLEKLDKMDRSRFPLVDPYIQYMKIGQKGLNKTTVNYIQVLEKYNQS